MSLVGGLVLVSTLVIGSIVAGLAIPSFSPSIRAVNSHSLQIGQVVGSATLHISIPSKSLYYDCIVPLVYGSQVSPANPAPAPDPSHAIIIDPENSTLCHRVNG